MRLLFLALLLTLVSVDANAGVGLSFGENNVLRQDYVVKNEVNTPKPKKKMLKRTLKIKKMKI